jgi:hypothetical protein
MQTNQTNQAAFTLIPAGKDAKEVAKENALQTYEIFLDQVDQMVAMLEDAVSNKPLYVMEAENLYLCHDASNKVSVTGILNAQIFENKEEAMLVFGGIRNGNQVEFQVVNIQDALCKQIAGTIELMNKLEAIIEGRKTTRTYTRKTAVQSMKDEMQEKQEKQAKEESTEVTAEEKQIVAGITTEGDDNAPF